MQREKRSRACKLYDAYRIISLYRELFDVCRFASTPTYCLFHHESARTPRGQKVKVNKKHCRFLERSNEVTPFHPGSRLKPSGRKFVHAAGKNVAVHESYTTHIASLHYIDNFLTYVVSRRSRSRKKHRRFMEHSNEEDQTDSNRFNIYHCVICVETLTTM